MARRRAVKENNSRKGLLDFVLTEIDSSFRRGNRLSYEPYTGKDGRRGQLQFHQSDSLGRYVAGANRAGKSDAEVMEAIWWATDTHPYLDRPESWGTDPLRIRFVVVDIVKGVEDIILPKIKRWCATSDFVDGSFEKSWNPRQLMFTFSNGSTIQFLTHGMELDKHGGVPLHAVFFDEIPPQNVFNENMMRLVDFNGFWVIAATAVQGMGWTYDYIWEPWGNDELPFVDCFQLWQEDNPHLEADKVERGKYYLAMEDAERTIREEGAFVAKSGLVFPTFSKKTHVLPQPLDFHEFRDWQWYSSADFGWNNPTAWLWHAVAPDGRIYTFSEHYKSYWTVDEHAKLIHEREQRKFQKSPDIRVGDPAGNQHQMNTGTSVIQEYALRGLYVATDMIPKDPAIGIEKMQQYIAIQPFTGWGAETPTWMISPECVSLIRELSRLQWESYESDKKAYELNKKETVRKKDDHAFDAGKYFFTLMPDLRPILPETGPGAQHLTFAQFMTYVNDSPGVVMHNETWDTQPTQYEPFDTEETAWI